MEMIAADVSEHHVIETCGVQVPAVHCHDPFQIPVRNRHIRAQLSYSRRGLAPFIYGHVDTFRYGVAEELELLHISGIHGSPCFVPVSAAEGQESRELRQEREKLVVPVPVQLGVNGAVIALLYLLNGGKSGSRALFLPEQAQRAFVEKLDGYRAMAEG